jgi:hypothetical protein
MAALKMLRLILVHLSLLQKPVDPRSEHFVVWAIPDLILV